jgi:nitric oxide reductase NorD protein
MAERILTAEQIEPLLEHWLEAEFTRHPMQPHAEAIAALALPDQSFILDWARRSAAVNIHVAHMFVREAPRLLAQMDHRTVEAWVLQALDEIDRGGMKAGLDVLRDPARFVRLGRERAVGAVFSDIAGVLRNFVRGLSGRALNFEQGSGECGAWTDTETLFLPPVIAGMESAQDNFLLAKAMATLLWAQTRFGTFHIDIAAACANHDNPGHALRAFLQLETLRLEAAIARDLQGLARDMQHLRKLAGAALLDPQWRQMQRQVSRIDATSEDSLALLAQACTLELPVPAPYQGELRPDSVASIMAARKEREKMLLRVKLAEIAEDAQREPQQPEQNTSAAKFELKESDIASAELPRHELLLDDNPVPLPDEVRDLLTSIQLDFGDIPPEYLTPAGPGEYDPNLYQPQEKDPDAVWGGTYHEDGAVLYPEWDFRRQHYRKNWCVMREKDVAPVHDDFVSGVLNRYAGLARQLRRTFEAMRDQDRVEKRQLDGDDLDFDALVEALGDAHAGRDMSDRLFTHLHRNERDIAVLFLVDMSGSTKGWINEVERAALLLLCEALESLGDRYAIYGFSGMTRKKCELFRIKRFDERYGDEVRARISGIRPQDYTRMGFAIRHATQLLSQIDARTRLLITLSDGKPDDYTDNYRGRYGIEDTRRALLEAARAGVRPFCITVDKEARDYLPHLYGAARYTIVDDVARLPFKVAGIYRRLTH